MSWRRNMFTWSAWPPHADHANMFRRHDSVRINLQTSPCYQVTTGCTWNLRPASTSMFPVFVQYTESGRSCFRNQNDMIWREYWITHTGSRHADGGLVDHADDGDGHANALSEHVYKHEETDDGNTETRGAEQRSRLNSIGSFIHVFSRIATASQQHAAMPCLTMQRATSCCSHKSFRNTGARRTETINYSTCGGTAV